MQIYSRSEFSQTRFAVNEKLPIEFFRETCELAGLCMLDGVSEHLGISAAKSPQMLETWHSLLISGPKCSDPSGVVKYSPSRALQIFIKR